jgi:hypothetical protein
VSRKSTEFEKRSIWISQECHSISCYTLWIKKCSFINSHIPRICHDWYLVKACADFPSRLATADAFSKFLIMLFHLTEFSRNLDDLRSALLVNWGNSWFFNSTGKGAVDILSCGWRLSDYLLDQQSWASKLLTFRWGQNTDAGQNFTLIEARSSVCANVRFREPWCWCARLRCYTAVLRPVSHGPQPRTNPRKLWRQCSDLTSLESATRVL